MNPCIPHLKWCRVPQLSSESEISITFRFQLCSTRYAAFRIKNCSKSTSAIHAYRKKEMVPHAPYINYRLKSEVSIMLCCQLCSTRYTAVRIKNCLKSTSAITIATMTNTDDFHYRGKPSHAIAKSILFAVSKDEWDTKEDTGKSMRMHCTYCGMPKGTCWAEVMSKSEKIKPVALAVIKLRLSEGISQSVSH